MAERVFGSTPELSADADFIGMFKRYGLLMIAVPALVVAVVVGFVVFGVIVHDFGAVFAAGINGTISENYDAESFTYDPTSFEYSRLASAISKRVADGRLTALRVQDLDGTVIYSTDSDELGTVVPLDSRHAIAAEQAKVDSYVTASDPLLPVDGILCLVVVGPVEFSDSAVPQGVVTSFKPFSSVLPSIRGAVLAVTATVLLGALVAYGLLRLLVRRAERQLRENQERTEMISRRLGRSLNELDRTYLGTLQTLNAAVNAKDHYTALHSLHVADYACALGLRLEMDDDVTSLERAGLLHDIGKIGVAEAVLQKSGGLTEDEYSAVRGHSAIGATMIETVPFLAAIVPAVRHHHERWDGKGYPDGLSAEQTPVLARVLAVADAFDAMTSERPYRPSMSVAAAKAELMSCRGTQFDPHLTDVFIELIEEGIIVVGNAV